MKDYLKWIPWLLLLVAIIMILWAWRGISHERTLRFAAEKQAETNALAYKNQATRTAELESRLEASTKRTHKVKVEMPDGQIIETTDTFIDATWVLDRSGDVVTTPIIPPAPDTHAVGEPCPELAPVTTKPCRKFLRLLGLGISSKHDTTPSRLLVNVGCMFKPFWGMSPWAMLQGTRGMITANAGVGF